MRRAALLLALLAGCHCEVARCARSLGNRIAARAHGGACENRIEYGDDDGVDTIGTFQYDDAGHITSFRQTSADGTLRFALTRAYDDAGRRVHQWEEDHLSGAVHREASWEYDAAGRIARLTTWFDDERDATDYHYLPDGRLDRRVSGDDVVEYRYEEGETAVVEEAHGDWGWRYTFRDGRMIREESRGGGVPDEHPILYTYQGAHLVRREFRGVQIGTYEWRDDRVVRISFDEGADGTVEQTEDFEYDHADRLVRHRWAGSDWGVITTYTWTGRDVERVERRTADDGELIEHWTLIRGCWGDREMSLLLSPIAGWKDHLDAIDETLERDAMFGAFPEVM